MLGDHIDLRVVKTQKNIQETFIRLLNEKDFNAITIQNILDEALINRTTFYKHYHDKYHLADIIIENLLIEWEKKIKTRFVVVQEELADYIMAVTNMLYRDRDKVLALSNVQTREHNLWEDFRQIFKKSYVGYFSKTTAQEQEVLYRAELFASIVITTLKWQLKSDDVDSTIIIISKLIKKMDDTLRSFN